MEYNIADLLECVVDTVPERVALVCGDRRLTYAEFEARANRLAHAFAASGVKAGDHVGLHLYNSAEFVEASFALLKLRAVPININYRYVSDELAYLFDNADLVGLVFQREFAPLIGPALDGLDKLTTFVYVEDQSGADLGAMPSATEFERFAAEGSPERDFEARSPDDVYIVYTGGTTGMPRGVMWRHEDLFFAGLQGGRAGAEDIESPEELAEAITEGAPLNIHPAAPLIHGAAQFATWIAMFSGGKAALVPGRSFNPKLTCALIGAEEINVINLVGDAMVLPLAEELERGDYDVSTLVALSSAGAILSASVRDRLQAQIPDAMILNNYGASETGHQGTALSGVPGRPRFFMHSASVLDDDFKPVEPGSGVVGKLARTGHIPLGYYKDPEKTARTFPVVDGTRWVIPGDMALLEEDGTITLLGRGSICINTGGEKVYPEEVEEAFKAHDAVQDAIVVGIPDDRWGERVTALVLLGGEATTDELEAHCRTKVAGYKVPREIHIVESLNRQPSGKPDYRWAKKVSMELSG